MMDKDFALKAVHDDQLWTSINHHRAFFSSIKGIDYTRDLRKEICLTPPAEVLALWEEDYGYMQRHMIYDGMTLPFVDLLQRMKEVERRFHED